MERKSLHIQVYSWASLKDCVSCKLSGFRKK